MAKTATKTAQTLTTEEQTAKYGYTLTAHEGRIVFRTDVAKRLADQDVTEAGNYRITHVPFVTSKNVTLTGTIYAHDPANVPTTGTHVLADRPGWGRVTLNEGFLVVDMAATEIFAQERYTKKGNRLLFQTDRFEQFGGLTIALTLYIQPPKAPKVETPKPTKRQTAPSLNSLTKAELITLLKKLA